MKLTRVVVVCNQLEVIYKMEEDLVVANSNNLYKRWEHRIAQICFPNTVDWMVTMIKKKASSTKVP